ncbi:MAG: type IV pilus twitching motility protein PilT, partial [Thermoanaerobaculia bacterium]
MTPRRLLLYSRANMSMGQDEVLFGRIALHYKLVSQDQLADATSAWSQEGGLRGLGEILVERGVLNLRQLEQLRAVQRDYLAKQKAQQQGQPAPPAPAPQPAPAPPPARQSGWREATRRLDALLTIAVGQRASDLHLHCGAPIKLRHNGELFDMEPGALTPDLSESLIREILTPEQQRDLGEHGQIDFAYTISGVGRFRANAYRQQRGLDAVFRAIPPNPPSLEDLGLPATLARFANFHQGMVLLTGPAGCGKSSTLAAMVNIINQERQDHIITIEDPIEFVHPNKNCIITQRQVGVHTGSFKSALRAALREDPDIILVGELRDLET